MTAMLWKLHDVCADVSAARAMRGALTQHLMFTPAGLTSVLVQIGAEQAAYVLASGCAGCPNDQCVAGCRMDLLRRVVKASHPGSGLTLVRRGLLARPYARAVMAWPTSNADVLDADLLAGWSHARLLQHWRGGRGVQSTAVLLAVSADGDDPGGRLRTRGWKTCPLPWRDGWFDRLMMYALRRLTKRSLYKPYLLLPAPSAVRRAPRSTRSRTAATEADDAVAHDHAATIAAYVHAAGGRLELIDLASDERTARLHLNSTPAKDVATVWRTLATEADGLEVRAATQSVVLDPANPAFPGLQPPLLLLGTRPDGAQRWRPIDATHHLVVSGKVDGGTVAGMIGATAERRADLHVGVVDLTATGMLAVELAMMPGRLTTEDSGDAYELLTAINNIADPQQPVLAIVHAEDAPTAERTALMMLRAALHREVSLLLVVPTVADVPRMLQGRCPHLQMHDNASQWQMSEGAWERSGPVVLRPPWREPRHPTSDVAVQRAVPLLSSIDGFWAVPPELADLSAILADTATMPAPVPAQTKADEVTMPARVSDHADESVHNLPLPPVPVHRSPSSRIYARPVQSSGRVALAEHEALPSSVASSASEEHIDTMTGSASSSTGHEHSQPDGGLARMGIDQQPVTKQPGMAGVMPVVPAHRTRIAYQPREDRSGKLMVEPALLALTLAWAEATDPDNTGVSITHFRSGVGLPSKAHNLQLCKALRDHGLIREALKREGWFRLLTVAEAVEAGNLPAGPWYTPVVAADSAASGVEATIDQPSVGTYSRDAASVVETMR